MQFSVIFNLAPLNHEILASRKSHFNIFDQGFNQLKFLEAISSQLGQKISLVIESGEVIASPAAIKVETAQKQLNDDKDALLENAAVKDILDSFGGKIIDESIKKVGP